MTLLQAAATAAETPVAKIGDPLLQIGLAFLIINIVLGWVERLMKRTNRNGRNGPPAVSVPQSHLDNALLDHAAVARIESQASKICDCLISQTKLMETVVDVQRDQKDILAGVVSGGRWDGRERRAPG